MVLDGVFTKPSDGEPPKFESCPAPSDLDLLKVARGVFRRMTKYLEAKGYLSEDGEATELCGLDAWYVKSLAEPSMLMPTRDLSRKNSGLEYGGFTVHAGVTVAGDDKAGREKLCRYAARPAFADDQLRFAKDGRIEFRLRRKANNGQSVVLLEPVRFLRRLAWLLPPPRQHQVRYAGVLGPRAKWRREIVPPPRLSLQLVLWTNDEGPARGATRLRWADLLRRVYIRPIDYSLHRASDQAGTHHTSVPSAARPSHRRGGPTPALGRRPRVLSIAPRSSCIAADAMDQLGSG